MSAIEKTMKSIEELEQKWSYRLSDTESKAHSFGRIKEDGDTVAFWSIPKNTGLFLEMVVKLLKPRTILELGCSVGYSTLFFARAIQKTQSHIYTTEILPTKIKLAKKHFAKAQVEDKVTLIEKDIFEVLNNWETKIDFVFLDADKDNYLAYVKLLEPLLSDSGVIVVDNANKVRMADGSLLECTDIITFTHHIQQSEIFESVKLDFDNGLLIIRKLLQ